MSDDFLTVIARAQAADLQRVGLRVVTDVAAVDEPITLAAAYRHIRIDTYQNSSGDTLSDDDDWLLLWSPAARQWCEQYLGIALAPRTVELASNAFPSVAVATPPGASLALTYGPVRSVESVSYLSNAVDSNGDLILDSNGDPTRLYFENSNGDPLYELDSFSVPALLIPKYGESWPTDVLNAVNSVRIRYTAGYAVEQDSNGTLPIMPRHAYAAMVVLLAYLYKNREGVDERGSAADDLPQQVMALLDLVPGRQRLGFA